MFPFKVVVQRCILAEFHTFAGHTDNLLDLNIIEYIASTEYDILKVTMNLQGQLFLASEDQQKKKAKYYADFQFYCMNCKIRQSVTE